MSCKPGISKRVRFDDTNFKQNLLKWLEESNDEDSDDLYGLSEHDFISEVDDELVKEELELDQN